MRDSKLNFINTARGEIAGAGLDVLPKEPLPENHPFRDFSNALLSPQYRLENRYYIRNVYERGNQ